MYNHLKNNDDEHTGENQFQAAEVHASGHPLPAAARHVVLRLRPVPHRKGRGAGHRAADHRVPEPGTAGGHHQGRGHRQQIREHDEIMGSDTGLHGRGQH